jgi:hypothetical protein
MDHIADFELQDIAGCAERYSNIGKSAQTDAVLK